jgi:hypothetical protein
MPGAKVTAFRFTDEELEILGVIEGHTGVGSRTRALRKVLRSHESEEGLEPTELEPKKPAPVTER